MSYSYISFTDVGLKRTDNEDAIGVFNWDDGLLSIVCDGLGGNKAGDIASKLAVEIIHDHFIKSTEKDYLERIKSAIIFANQNVMEKGVNDLNLKGMATTAEVLFLKNNSAYWGHVGDSRIYNIKNAKIKQLTKDHSLVQKLLDDGFLTVKEAENHPNKNIIMRALGDTLKLEVDLSKMKYTSGDDTKFFLCTDGVTGVVKDQELENILITYKPEEITSILSELIKGRGAPDNFSFVLISKC